MESVIANSTPLIALAKINELNHLKEIYSQIMIPKAVYDEVAILGKGKKGSIEITKAEWIKVKVFTENPFRKSVYKTFKKSFIKNASRKTLRSKKVV